MANNTQNTFKQRIKPHKKKSELFRHIQRKLQNLTTKGKFTNTSVFLCVENFLLCAENFCAVRRQFFCGARPIIPPTDRIIPKESGKITFSAFFPLSFSTFLCFLFLIFLIRISYSSRTQYLVYFFFLIFHFKIVVDIL